MNAIESSSMQKQNKKKYSHDDEKVFDDKLEFREAEHYKADERREAAVHNRHKDLIDGCRHPRVSCAGRLHERKNYLKCK